LSELIEIYPWTGWLLAALVGLLTGSFANVVIARLPRMLELQWERDYIEMTQADSAPVNSPEEMSAIQPAAERFNLAWPASHCPKCKHPLRWYENVPVISYLFQKGRCRHCHQGIRAQYPIVELLSMLLVGFAVYYFGFNATGWSYAALLWVLMVLTWIDTDHMLLPDQLTLPLLWAGLLLSVAEIIPVTPVDSIIGATAGYLFLWSLYWLFKLTTGKEGMGYGDFKLLAALGAWLGWQMLPLIILLSSVVGAFLGILIMALKGKDKNQPLPFGPYLVIGGVIALFWGHEIYQWYWRLAVY